MPPPSSGIPHYYLIALELVVLAFLTAAGALFDGYARRSFDFGFHVFSSLGRRRRLAVALCGFLPVVLRFALLPWIEVPKPAIMEEFTYLLASDTFASGRLTNPPHPMAEHFETFQVLQRPTYSSVRPPGQGLFLAAGQVMTGLPWMGVVLSVAIFCGSICWMLQGWFPPGWALLGGFLAGLRLGVFSYWMNSYWGGAVAGLGGCLVLGATPRIWRSPRVLDACLMAVGIFFLFTSRAFEGLFLLLPVAAVMAAWLLSRGRIRLRDRWLRFLVPLLLVLAASTGWVAYYNFRVTGSPETSPYVLARRERNIAPPFLWQNPGPVPVYRIDVFKAFYQSWELDSYTTTKKHYGAAMFYRAYDFWRVYLRPEFTLPLIALPWAWRDRRIRLFLAVAIVASVGQATETWFPTYYAAPLVGVVFAVEIQCMRHMRLWTWRGRRVGEAAVAALCATCILVFLLIAGIYLAGKSIRENETSWASTTSRLRERSLVEDRLAAQPGKQLAIVRYLPGHNVHFAWVFNCADIDGSKVVWARDLGPKENEELLRYFRDRKAWLIEPDHASPLVVPYERHKR